MNKSFWFHVILSILVVLLAYALFWSYGTPVLGEDMANTLFLSVELIVCTQLIIHKKPKK